MTASPSSFRSRFGIFLVVLGFICPVFGLLVPLLELPTARSTAIVAFFMIGGPELFMILGGLLAGKEGILLVKNRLKRILGLPEGSYPAPKAQYHLAIFFIILWLLLAIIPGYVPSLLHWPFVKENQLWVAIIADLILIVSIFFLGGDQMVRKIGKVSPGKPGNSRKKTNKKSPISR